MSARERLAALDDLPADELCQQAESALGAMLTVMAEETSLLRAGRYREATTLTSEKTRLAQDYVGFARSVQRQLPRLSEEAPEALDRLHLGHDRLATQLADNLRVIVTARSVAEDLLTDVASTLGNAAKPKTYDVTGQLPARTGAVAKGISVNRAL
ncbi:MAG TPA: hypothetical protein VGM83_04740 [Devosiaceae bacterium]|jgi:hypothetical protein